MRSDILLTKMNLDGEWKLQLDEGKSGLSLPFTDSIMLPGTTSYARKGPQNETKLIGALTDEYSFEGFAWYSREVEISDGLAEKNCFLYLERTRMTTVWVGGREVGSRDSLNTPHLYELTGLLQSGSQTITVRVDNTDYPTKGGHMTSPDTQTNWNGITGRIELQFYSESYLTDIQLYPNLSARSVKIAANLQGELKGSIAVSAASWNSDAEHRWRRRNTASPRVKFRLNIHLGRMRCYGVKPIPICMR